MENSNYRYFCSFGWNRGQKYLASFPYWRGTKVHYFLS